MQIEDLIFSLFFLNMKYYFLILLIGLCATSLHAQEVITTLGSYDENATGLFSWTIGEGVIETFTNTNNILTQGFQQSKLTVTSINDLKDSGIELSVYPKPKQFFINRSKS